MTATEMTAEQASQPPQDNAAYLALIEDDGDCPELVAALHAANVEIKREFAARGVFFI
jgi:hypothetical protein